MKQRNLLTTVILGYVTLGIYGLYWLIVTRRSLVEKLEDKKAIPSVLLLFVPFFLVVFAVIVAIFFRSNTAANIMIILTYLIAFIVGPIISIYWFYKYSHALHKVTNGTDPILHLVLMIIMWSAGLGPVWILLAQNDINKYLEGAGAQPDASAPQQSVPVAASNPAPNPEPALPPAEAAEPRTPESAPQGPAPGLGQSQPVPSAQESTPPQDETTPPKV